MTTLGGSEGSQDAISTRFIGGDSRTNQAYILQRVLGGADALNARGFSLR